jgi:hypothetical protein
MDTSADASGDPAIRTIEHELDLVRSAIALVASGGAPSVFLGSLRFGEQLIEPARKLGLASGVRIVPVWSADEAGAGLSFERMTDG